MSVLRGRPGNNNAGKRVLPKGIVAVVLVWAPPEAITVASGRKPPAASVADRSMEHVPPGVELQDMENWRGTGLYMPRGYARRLQSGSGIDQHKVIVIAKEWDGKVLLQAGILWESVARPDLAAARQLTTLRLLSPCADSLKGRRCFCVQRNRTPSRRRRPPLPVTLFIFIVVISDSCGMD